jgi:hypothetical protein
MTDSGPDFVEVYRAANTLDAGLAKSVLEAAGISVLVTEDSVAALYPNIAWAAPRVLVAPAHAEEAAKILRELKESKPPHPSH